MPTITLDIKVNNNIVRTITLDDYVANGYNTSSFTKTELTDRDRVKQISMTEWINIQSFVKKNKIHLNDTESGVLASYIKDGIVTPKQATVLMIVLSKVQNHNYTLIH